MSAWYNSFLNPTEVGNFRENRVNEIQRTISFRDKPAGIVGATDPTPDDVVAQVVEYEVGPGDALLIQLADFLEIGGETSLPVMVNELGQVDLPQLGKVYIEGMTASEAKNEIIQEAKAKQIYREEDTPTVIVTVQEGRQRLFYLGGDVPNPNTFAIPRPDFRLREAILLGGGLTPLTKTVYVFRNEPNPKNIAERFAKGGATSRPKEHEGPLPAPPVSPVTISTLDGAAGPLPAGPATSPQPSSRPSSAPALALPAEIAEQELMEAILPTSASTRPANSEAPATQPSSGPAESPSRIPSYIFVNDKFIEAPPADSAQPAAQTIEETPAPSTGPETTEPVNWEQLASEEQRRVIRIPADKLRDGDPNYNITVRARDWIRVDAGPQGLYYLTGHVVRPGPYPFSGEEITLTQAIATAGGLDQLAWPTRCEIRRRIDQDREETTQWDLARITEGKDPDLYIKPNDIVRVGTHAIAPLLATIRNSFRLTYGFGFVYDRNFADIDAVSGDINPDLRRRSERQQRFPGLF